MVKRALLPELYCTYTVQRLQKKFFRSLTVSPKGITTYEMDPDLQRSTCQAL